MNVPECTMHECPEPGIVRLADDAGNFRACEKHATEIADILYAHWKNASEFVYVKIPSLTPLLHSSQ